MTSRAFAELATCRLGRRVQSPAGQEKLVCDRLDDSRPQFDDETVCSAAAYHLLVAAAIF